MSSFELVFLVPQTALINFKKFFFIFTKYSEPIDKNFIVTCRSHIDKGPRYLKNLFRHNCLIFSMKWQKTWQNFKIFIFVFFGSRFSTRLLFLFLYCIRFLHFYFASVLPLKKVSHACLAVIYGIKSYYFRPSFCFFALYLPLYGINNYILLFRVSLVIIIIIIIIIIIVIT